MDKEESIIGQSKSGQFEPTRRTGLVGPARQQVLEIAQSKLADLNTDSTDSAMRTIEGTARSMGIDVV